MEVVKHGIPEVYKTN